MIYIKKKSTMLPQAKRCLSTALRKSCQYTVREINEWGEDEYTNT
jgi:hypothetical protein